VNLSDANPVSTFKTRVEMDGFAVIPACLEEATVDELLWRARFRVSGIQSFAPQCSQKFTVKQFENFSH
jgi:hypothetical protein